MICLIWYQFDIPSWSCHLFFKNQSQILRCFTVTQRCNSSMKMLWFYLFLFYLGGRLLLKSSVEVKLITCSPIFPMLVNLLNPVRAVETSVEMDRSSQQVPHSTSFIWNSDVELKPAEKLWKYLQVFILHPKFGISKHCRGNGVFYTWEAPLGGLWVIVKRKWETFMYIKQIKMIF